MFEPAVLQAINAHLDRMDAKTQNMLRPFRQEPSADPWIRDVLFAYARYFLHVLFDHVDALQAERTLAQELVPLVPTLPLPTFDLSAIEAALASGFQARGYAFLGGYTLPYRGPYIWKRTEHQLFLVELPDRSQPVAVYFLHDFLLRSWLHFQTFGIQGTGGWY